MRVDCHCDTVLHYAEAASLERLPQAHLDFSRLREYLDLSVFALWIEEARFGEDSPAEFRRVWQLLRQDVAQAPALEPLLWREQLTAPGSPLLLYALEGAAPLGRAGENLDEFYALGLRWLGLTWNGANAYAGGCGSDGGLTPAGAALVARCNELGVLLDGAHLNDESFDQLIACSKHPCIDSHTVCRALCDAYPRSITDKQMEAIAEKGGVVCICMVPDFLGGGGLRDFCRHVEYAVALIGAAHVGFGADYDGAPLGPELAGVQFLPAVYAGLAARGLKEDIIAQVAGGSVWALLQQVLPGKAAKHGRI